MKLYLMTRPPVRLPIIKVVNFNGVLRTTYVQRNIFVYVQAGYSLSMNAYKTMDQHYSDSITVSGFTQARNTYIQSNVDEVRVDFY